MHQLYSFLIASFAVVKARDIGKTLRTMPFVTNSLVNLGKMDISFYLNARPQDLAAKSEARNFEPSSFFAPKYSSVDAKSCPCSSASYFKDPIQNHPSDLISKILSGNDFFSYKEPDSSTLCCDSHENVQQDILIEFSPKQTQILSNSQHPLSMLPFLLNSMQNKPALSTTQTKPKALEIFFYPKKSTAELDKWEKIKELPKKDIKVVGDKEIKNQFKTNQFVPPLPSSVKKDLGIKNISKQVTEKEEKETIDKKSNTV